MSHSLAGTPPYMAPEAIRCELPGPSFDLWSLAVVLFEALTGVRPFHGSTLAQTLAHIQSAAPPDPRAVLPLCAQEVSDFFAKVLAPERRDRPGTSRQFAERLAELRQRALAS
jgi:serine/threonine-protein kinase